MILNPKYTGQKTAPENAPKKLKQQGCHKAIAQLSSVHLVLLSHHPAFKGSRSMTQMLHRRVPCGSENEVISNFFGTFICLFRTITFFGDDHSKITMIIIFWLNIFRDHHFLDDHSIWFNSSAKFRASHHVPTLVIGASLPAGETAEDEDVNPVRDGCEITQLTPGIL